MKITGKSFFFYFRFEKNKEILFFCLGVKNNYDEFF
jgi:hypothetical protein